MIIGTIRPEEARVKDSRAGHHHYKGFSFEVFWDDEDRAWGSEPRNYDEEGNPVQPGWYWWPCFPGCLPDGEAHGPFASSCLAYVDARQYLKPENEECPNSTTGGQDFP